jgi:hypothetical protein
MCQGVDDWTCHGVEGSRTPESVGLRYSSFVRRESDKSVSEVKSVTVDGTSRAFSCTSPTPVQRTAVTYPAVNLVDAVRRVDVVDVPSTVTRLTLLTPLSPDLTRCLRNVPPRSEMYATPPRRGTFALWEVR